MPLGKNRITVPAEQAPPPRILAAREESKKYAGARCRGPMCLLEKTGLYPVAGEKLPARGPGREAILLSDTLSEAQKTDWSRERLEAGRLIEAVAINTVEHRAREMTRFGSIQEVKLARRGC